MTVQPRLTYSHYKAVAAARGEQPMTIHWFNALVLAGFNPITQLWR